MKKLLALLLFAVPSVGYCDTKISALLSTTTLNSVDIIPVVTNPSTSPANRTISKANLSTTLDILTNASATSTYLTQSSATTSYVTKSSATTTYCRSDGTNCVVGTGGGVTVPSSFTWTGVTVGTDLTIGGAGAIRSTSTLQSGATFYTSSGTVVNFNTTGGAVKLGGVTVTLGDGASQLFIPSFGNGIGTGAYIQVDTVTAGNPLIVRGILSKDVPLISSGIAFGSTSNTLSQDASNFHWRPATFELVVGTNATTSNVFGSGIRAWKRTASATQFPLLILNPFQNTLGLFNSTIFDASAGASPFDSNSASFNIAQSTLAAISFTTAYQSSNSGSYQFQGVAGDAFMSMNTSSVTMSKPLVLASLTNTVLAVNSLGVVVSTTVTGGPNLSSTQTWTGQNSWTTPSQSTFTYGLVVGSLTVNGSGAGLMNLTEGSTSTITSVALGHDLLWADSVSHKFLASFNGGVSTFTISGASQTIPAGNFLASTGDGMFRDGGFTSAVPVGPSWAVQFSSAGAFGGSSGFQYNGSSVSIVNSSVTIRGANIYNSFGGLFDISLGGTSPGDGKTILVAGSDSAGDQFAVTNGNPIYMGKNGSLSGDIYIGNPSIGRNVITTLNQTQNYLDFYNGQSIPNEMAFGTAVSTGADIVLLPQGTETVRVSTRGITMVSTGTTPTLKLTANGTYGTSVGTSGGFLMDCSGGGSGAGMCAQFYTNAGIQSALGGIVNIMANNSAWNEPGIYMLRNNANNNSDILIDALGTPAITLRETAQTNPSAKKWQIVTHNGLMRFENRLNDDSAFGPYMQVSSATFFNDIYVGPTYGGQSNNTQFQVQSSTGNVYSMTLSTQTSLSSYQVTVTTNTAVTLKGRDVPPDSQALCLIAGQLGHCTSIVGAGGGCTCTTP